MLYFDLLDASRPAHRPSRPSPHLVSAETSHRTVTSRTTLFQVDASGAWGSSTVISMESPLANRLAALRDAGCNPSVQCRIHFLVRPLAAPPAAPMTALKLALACLPTSSFPT